MSNQASSRNFLKWFDPRYRKIGSWAFILNRVTALGLTLYLIMHLMVLSLLVKGPQYYDKFINLAHSPFVLFGELLVIAAGVIHGINGIRIALTSIGIGIHYQKQIFVISMLIALIFIAIFAWAMFF